MIGTLQPFSSGEKSEIDCVEYRLSGNKNNLLIRYTLRGTIAKLRLPRPIPGEVPKRSHGLWRHTCFELFIKEHGEGHKGTLREISLRLPIGMYTNFVVIVRGFAKWKR